MPLSIINPNIAITASPFQFYAFLARYNGATGRVIVVQPLNDTVDYAKVLKLLAPDASIELKVIKWYVKPNFNSFFKKMLKIVDTFLLYLKLLVYCLPLRRLSNTIAIGSSEITPIRFAANLLFKKTIVLGDGASILWGESYTRKTKLLGKLEKSLGFKSAMELDKTIDRDFFRRNHDTIKLAYSELKVKKGEAWIIGSSAPFMELHDLNYYTKEVRENIDKVKKPIEKYFHEIEDVVSNIGSDSVLYFPHRNEPDTEFNKFSIFRDNIFLEVVPLSVGYLPEFLIGSSSCIFSYAMISQITDKKISLYFSPFNDYVNEVYKSFGAIPIEI